MAKKKWHIDGNTILIIVIAGIAVIAFMSLTGTEFPSLNLSGQGNPSAQLDQNDFEGYNVTIAFQPENPCKGDNVSATITSNIPNGICAVFADAGTGWTFIQNITLDAQGNYSASQPANTAGTLITRAVCCDAQGLCKTSNEATITITDCSQCSDTDGGKDVFIKGTCTDDTGNTEDLCPQGNFTQFVSETWCENNQCMGASMDCYAQNAKCYNGRCIKDSQDTDGDGFPDLDEYYYGSDPNDPNDTPESQQDCDQECSAAGYNLGGYWSGGISCDDFYHYLSGPQCCCLTEIVFCQDACYNAGFNHSATASEVGIPNIGQCVSYADDWCVQYKPPEGYYSASVPALEAWCCCFNCHMD